MEFRMMYGSLPEDVDPENEHDLYAMLFGRSDYPGDDTDLDGMETSLNVREQLNAIKPAPYSNLELLQCLASGLDPELWLLVKEGCWTWEEAETDQRQRDAVIDAHQAASEPDYVQIV